MAVPQVKIDATEARLAGMTLPKGAVWAQSARAAALSRVNTAGLPGRRDEYWKYTNPTDLVGDLVPSTVVGDETPVFDLASCVTLVFVDGVFDAAASDDLAVDGLVIERFADVVATDLHWARDLLGVSEAAGQVPVARPLAALNTAFATDGVVIHAIGAGAKPVHIHYRSTSETSDVMLHHIVKVDAGASMTVLETGCVGARSNTVMEADIADNGALDHIRMQGRDDARRALTHTFTRLGNESAFKSFTLTANGQLTRNEAIIELTGDNASAHVAGTALGNGDFHHDDTVFVTHDALNCESRQVFKKVLRNGAVGVFQGKILVKAGAQKTDGYQISQALLLDDDCQFLAKPELEIYADDVACSHGSTTGAIDEEALFYLRSRGVPEAAAQDLLTLAFLAEAIDEIANETLADAVLARLEIWLTERR